MKLVELFEHFIIDLDGVVYIGSKPISGVSETICRLREMGKRVLFLTNDPRSSSKDYAKKLSDIDIPTAPEEVITSSTAVAYYLKEYHRPYGKTAYVVGTKALKEEIESIGVRIIQGEDAKKADFVIIGGHPEFNYEEMKIATLAVRNGALFIGTNRDPYFPTPEGLIPATGAILASIEVASGKRAITVGKPEPTMFELVKKKLNPKRGEKIAIVGDTLQTDILGGKRARIGTILVLSGSTTEKEVIRSKVKPDYIIRELSDILKEQRKHHA
ncbi:MAG: hypothetical protein KatS3mg078_0268 [Deltaproteobacteria bacterium]|jgi:phosphoglycolate/pyridoxal phosphate phosphatase family enzyme|nr:MAG: hypothetical protein KatS3mg078_0268 [Deltaproteobacteria bacterium]